MMYVHWYDVPFIGVLLFGKVPSLTACLYHSMFFPDMFPVAGVFAVAQIEITHFSLSSWREAPILVPINWGNWVELRLRLLLTLRRLCFAAAFTLFII